jgi:branched-chain amino acid transport system permease protein
MDISTRDMSSIIVKLCYAGLFLIVLALVYWLTETQQRAPWGRMIRAIRDNEDAAMAMGKDVEGRHRQTFVLGSAIVGIGGAMLVTLDGQFTPGSYQPLRFTFIIWIMVIVGGSGNYRGAILGAFVIWFAWVQAETGGVWVASLLIENLTEGSAARDVIEESAAYLRYVVMGLILILVMRFAPHGLIPEKTTQGSAIDD